MEEQARGGVTDEVHVGTPRLRLVAAVTHHPATTEEDKSVVNDDYCHVKRNIKKHANVTQDLFLWNQAQKLSVCFLNYCRYRQMII